MKLTIKFVKSYGTYGVYNGSKNLNTNSTSVLQALVLIRNSYPNAAVYEKHPVLGMVKHA